MTKQEIEDKIKKFNSIEKVFNIISTLNIEYLVKIFKDYLNQNYSNFVDESAKHFSEIDESLFFIMNPFIFEEILLSKELVISDEDSLLKFLLKRRSYILQNQLNENQEGRNEEDLFFFHYIHFECLSEEGIKLFLNEIDIDEINHLTWESLKKRLIMPTQSESRRNNKFYKCKEFFYEKDFNGIFKHLTDVSNGNILLNKTIEITCSKLCCGNLEKLVDFNCTDGYAHIYDENKQRWIQFDFKERKVQINSYLIQSSCRSSEDRLKSWKIEISNDGTNWEKIDEQNNVTELNGVNITKLFKVKMTNQFRFIRLFTDKECFSNSKSCFSIGKIEFYGTISE